MLLLMLVKRFIQVYQVLYAQGTTTVDIYIHERNGGMMMEHVMYLTETEEETMLVYHLHRSQHITRISPD